MYPPLWSQISELARRCQDEQVASSSISITLQGSLSVVTPIQPLSSLADDASGTRLRRQLHYLDVHPQDSLFQSSITNDYANAIPH
jgi:hypothetical protein